MKEILMIIIKILISLILGLIFFFLFAIITDIINVEILKTKSNFNSISPVIGLMIGVSIGWSYLSPFIINKAQNNGFKISKYLPNFKNQFKRIIIFRLFVIMQILGIFIIFILLVGYNWSIGDIFDSGHWKYYFLQNFLGLISIFGPFFITKSIDWILDAKD